MSQENEEERPEMSQDNEEDLHNFPVSELIKNSGSYPAFSTPAKPVSVKLPLKLAQKVGNPTCYSSVAATKGFYGTDKSTAIGNSYVCYRPDGGREGKWVAGQIRYIFDYQGAMTMAITRSKTYVGPTPDPFAHKMGTLFRGGSGALFRTGVMSKPIRSSSYDVSSITRFKMFHRPAMTIWIVLLSRNYPGSFRLGAMTSVLLMSRAHDL
ncbi:hypothetical protein EV360DRAFT_90769 [Lentinula raphanica]|nr:hypothetical protein EV360DRAFT_90769 [Lentinula raphanica]